MVSIQLDLFGIVILRFTYQQHSHTYMDAGAIERGIRSGSNSGFSYIPMYYPNLVIVPVDNNEHQRIDDVSTDRISYDIRSVETMGFAL